MNVVISAIREDSKYEGRYELSFYVNKVLCKSVYVYTKGEIQDKFRISGEEFAKLLIKK